MIAKHGPLVFWICLIFFPILVKLFSWTREPWWIVLAPVWLILAAVTIPLLATGCIITGWMIYVAARECVRR